MRKIKLFFVALAMLITSAAFAQNITIKGTVIDGATGEGIPFASVVVKNTTTGTAAGVDGTYSIDAPANATLVIGAIGYKSTEIAVNGQAAIDCQLTPDAEFLDDVIVVAYGTASRQSLTGSVSAIDSKTIEKTISSSATAALEGAAPGVQVNNTYGEPGTDPTIRIRGFGSVNGSNAPLYVVDGFQYTGNISDINSADIESISVLKDANSAALYGNRAANGVIIITTKSGKSEGKPVVTFSTNQGVYTRGIEMYDKLGADDWMVSQWHSLKNAMMSGTTAYTADVAAAYASEHLIGDQVKSNIYGVADNAIIGTDGKLKAHVLPGYTDLDWLKAVEKTGRRQEYGVSFASNTDKYNIFSSVDYLDEEGYVLNTGFNRLSGRINSTFTPTSWFKGGINLAATHQIQNYNSNANSNYLANPFYTAMFEGPVYPVYMHNADGSIMKDANGEDVFDTSSVWRNNRNIVYERLHDYERLVRNTIDASAFGTFTLPYGFSLTFKANKNFTDRAQDKYDNPVVGDGATNNGRYRAYNYSFETSNFQQQLGWEKSFGKNNFDVLAAHESYDYNYCYKYLMNKNMALEGIYEPGNFTETAAMPSGFSFRDATESYLGRVRYNYDEKYFLEGSFRRDGSSRLAEKSRWGNFWSVGGAWNISKENFMQSLSFVDYLKLRASFGEVGNLGNIDYYAYQALYESDPVAGNPALYQLSLSAEDIKWETTQTLDIALEGRLFDRLNFSFGYFDKVSKDLLFNVPLPLSAGSYIWMDGTNLSQLRNIGSVSNHGFELSLDADIIKTKDFKWNLGTDATFLKNVIKKLPDGEDISKGMLRYSEGHSIYEFYYYHFAGVDQLTGNSLYTIDPEKAEAAKTEEGGKYYVKIGDKEYTTYASKYGLRDWCGSVLPKVYGSVHTTLSWKGFSLYVLATYSVGGLVYDSSYASLMSMSAASPSALHVDILKSWESAPAGMTADSPSRIDPNGVPVRDTFLSTYNNAASDRWLTDASYFSLKNVTLSYTLPDKVLKAIKAKSITINAGVENAFITTARKGLNPQYNFSGGQDATYVTARIFNAGLTLKF